MNRRSVSLSKPLKSTQQTIVPTLIWALFIRRKKRLAQAASAFEKAVAVKPERGEYLYQYAMSLQELGQCEKAIPVLAKSSEVQPAHAETWLRLGECQLRLEKFDAAQDTLIRAINSKPLLAKSYLNLGTTLL